MMTSSVSFETKCYEGDWKLVASESYLRRVIAGCRYHFDHRVLYLNNFADYGPAIEAAERLVETNVVDEYCVVEEHAAEALKFFGLTKDSLTAGYNYSIAELVGIFRCKSRYLLHFSGDSQMADKAPAWVGDAIDVMETKSDVLVANPVWNGRYRQAQREALTEDGNWYYSYGFSDQCYLVKAASLQSHGVLGETHPASDRYPAYGGELFEKRVDAYMRNHKLHRITSKHASYVHKTQAKVGSLQWLKRRRAQKSLRPNA
jgi:hypothetical protein